MSDIKDFGRNSFIRTTGLIERMEKCTMTNHLFKLKKDGKTVGYLKIADGAVWYKDEQQVWDLYGGVDWLDFDTAHLFVTKDKNGQDVFAGDKIKTVIPDVSSDSLVGTIVQNDNPLACWMFKYRFDEERFGEKEHLAPAPDLQDIELIEGKDDD